MTKSSVYIKTFGCQMNTYDSDKMNDILKESLEIEKTDRPEDADILILNTCSIREKAQEKVFHQLGRWRSQKEINPKTIIGVGGCVASQEGKAILKRAPYVDLVFGPQTLHRLPQMIKKIRSGYSNVVDVSFPSMEKFDQIPEPNKSPSSAFLTIMEGCSKYCTYCIVPFTRGEEVSRPFNDILSEANRLAEIGVKEINLLGQNVNAYRDYNSDKKLVDLSSLIKMIAKIDGIERLRFTTSHPVQFRNSLIDTYGEVLELANHLHLPIQSGSDRILKLMKRGHTVSGYKSKIARLRQVRPNISISSDFIVGFPGEDDYDFNQTMGLVEEIGFDHSYSFVYSPRPGTPASDINDTVPKEIKHARLKILQDLINSQAKEISENMIGSTQTILVEKVSKKSDKELSGRTENNRWVNFQGNHSLIGSFVDVLIVESLPNCLRGRVVLDSSKSVA
tara:strand:+ start:36190 stop:37539 length:1350 start_codon:yes stop_codon:yes gene_type:complete